ncbi:MAG: phosphoribosylanthranilate isomerase [Cyanobacteria bacterium P01_E01_bin.34]
MFVKICGITQVEQGRAIADAMLQHGLADRCAIGFICVAQSKRYVSAEQIQPIVLALPRQVQTIGVFVDEQPERVCDITRRCGLSGVQLHGDESVDYCQRLRELLPTTKFIKAMRLRQAADLARLTTYDDVADAYLIDAYHPKQAGGTGLKADWTLLQDFRPLRPWLLAGGLTPENVGEAIAALAPDGVDLSSGVEVQPGIKDLAKVEHLLKVIGDGMQAKSTSV